MEKCGVLWTTVEKCGVLWTIVENCGVNIYRRIKGKFTQDLVSGTHDIVTGTQKMESDTQKYLLKFLYVSGYIYTKKSYLHT